jgi:hypothetical protein
VRSSGNVLRGSLVLDREDGLGNHLSGVGSNAEIGRRGRQAHERKRQVSVDCLKQSQPGEESMRGRGGRGEEDIHVATEDLVSVLLNEHLDETVGVRDGLCSRVGGEGELADLVSDLGSLSTKRTTKREQREGQRLGPKHNETESKRV